MADAAVKTVWLDNPPLNVVGSTIADTLTTALESFSATVAFRVGFQCVNQRSTRMPSGRASGAARTA